MRVPCMDASVGKLELGGSLAFPAQRQVGPSVSTPDDPHSSFTGVLGPIFKFSKLDTDIFEVCDLCHLLYMRGYRVACDLDTCTCRVREIIEPPLRHLYFSTPCHELHSVEILLLGR
jgi:hypothetical protein